MLIKCTECQREISDQAPACPGCGAPIKKAVGDVQTVELTGKTWKMRQIVGAVLLGIGIVLLFGSGSDGGRVIGIFMAFGGICVYIFSRVGAWWQHG